MTRAMVLAAMIGLAASPLLAGSKGTVSGEYVEARTAEVFTGGCIMSSEAETIGKQAVLAWKINHGSYNGVSLDGLSVVAAVAGDHNLGIQEMGGAKPAVVKSALYVDERANPAQRLALVSLATELSKGLVSNVVSVNAAPIQFADRGGDIRVNGGPVALDVNKTMVHDPSCGAMQWFHPFSVVDKASMGVAEEHAFNGSGLGTKWSDPNKRSAFFGTFTY